MRDRRGAAGGAATGTRAGRSRFGADANAGSGRGPPAPAAFRYGVRPMMRVLSGPVPVRQARAGKRHRRQAPPGCGLVPRVWRVKLWNAPGTGRWRRKAHHQHGYPVSIRQLHAPHRLIPSTSFETKTHRQWIRPIGITRGSRPGRLMRSGKMLPARLRQKSPRGGVRDQKGKIVRIGLPCMEPVCPKAPTPFPSGPFAARR